MTVFQRAPGPDAGSTHTDRKPEPSREGPAARLRRLLKKTRVWILLAAVLTAAAILTLSLRQGGDSTSLSPENPAPGGAMAAARVLADQGVEVVRPATLADAEAALEENGSSATLLLIDPSGWLSKDQLGGLDGAAARTVLVAPSFEQLEALAPGIRQGGLLPGDGESGTQPLQAGCSDPDAEAAVTIDGGGLGYRGPVTCFPSGSADDEEDPAGAYAAAEDGSVVVLGNPALLSNEAVADRGNAALVLRALGAQETLIWYQPTSSDVAASDVPSDPMQLLPQWVNPLLLWLLITALLAALWRGRRLGPLVVEPMPVVVRSAETAEGRARLYQDSRAVDRAASVLRSATLTRLAQRLRLGSAASAGDITRAAAQSAGRPFEDINHLLNLSRPAGEAALVQWSQDLQALEEEVNAS